MTDLNRSTEPRTLGDRITDTIAEPLTWVLAIVAMAISYWTQIGVAQGRGFQGWTAYAWPAISDAGAFCCLLLARKLVRSGRPTWEAWMMTAAATGVMVTTNVAANPTDLWGAVMHSWPPLFAFGVWHVLTHTLRPARRHVEPTDATTAPVRENEVTVLRVELARLRAELGRPGLLAAAQRLEVTPDVPLLADGVATDAMRNDMSATSNVADGDAGLSWPATHALSLRNDCDGDESNDVGASTEATPTRRQRPTREVVQRLLRRRGAAVTVDEIVKRTGVSARQAQRLLREERQAEQVDAAERPDTGREAER